MACETQRATLQSLQGRLASLEQSISEMPKVEQAQARRAAQPQFIALNKQITAASTALSQCLAALNPTAQRVPGAQPKNILDIQFTTPNFGGAGDWATPIAGGTFPFHQGFEWKQVMDTANEYDETPAGASGWAFEQSNAANDAIGLHPFGNDWEFSCVLDPPYLNLLSKGNTTLTDPTKTPATLTTLGVPQPDIQNVMKSGVLGVEWDSGLVPQAFQNEFHDGDRVAVFGRWIVDCGHGDFHTEIHPPLLLGAASVYKVPVAHPIATQPATQFTRAVFTSRPYMVGQTFANGKDTNQIYKDNSGDDGHFLEHLLKEIGKAETPIPFIGSLQVEAHPKIKEFPFKGVHLFEVIVRSPQPASIRPQHLVVSFHFTVRTPCSVTIRQNDATSVMLIFVLNSASYTPPPLPKRNDRNYSLSDLNSAFGPSTLDSAGEVVAGVFNAVLDPIGLAVLSRGLQTDQYDPLPPIDLRNTGAANAVNKAPANNIPAGKGMTVDNNQPFPVTGWLELGWVQTDVVAST